MGMTPGRGVTASPHPYRSGPSNMLASPARQGAGPPQAMGGAGPYGAGGGGGFAGGPGGQRGMFSGRVTTQQVGAGRLGAGAPASHAALRRAARPLRCACSDGLLAAQPFCSCVPPTPATATHPPARKPATVMGAPTTPPLHTHTLIPTQPHLPAAGQAAGGQGHHHQEGAVPRHARPRDHRLGHARAAGAGGAGAPLCSFVF